MKAVRQIGLLWLAIFLALAVPASAGSLEDGVTAYRQGDYANALRLLRPLAERGVAGAQVNLGRMYRFGRGVPQDYAAAHMWFTLAIAHDHAEARIARDNLVKRMTHGQIEEATLMAREWRAEHQQ